MPVEWLKTEWRRRGLLKNIQLTISGCLGPCDVPNVVLIATAEENSGSATLTVLSTTEKLWIGQRGAKLRAGYCRYPQTCYYTDSTRFDRARVPNNTLSGYMPGTTSQLVGQSNESNVFKVDFPVKPGETQFSLSYVLPIGSPETLRGRIVNIKGQPPGPVRLWCRPE